MMVQKFVKNVHINVSIAQGHQPIVLYVIIIQDILESIYYLNVVAKMDILMMEFK